MLRGAVRQTGQQGLFRAAEGGRVGSRVTCAGYCNFVGDLVWVRICCQCCWQAR